MLAICFGPNLIVFIFKGSKRFAFLELKLNLKYPKSLMECSSCPLSPKRVNPAQSTNVENFQKSKISIYRYFSFVDHDFDVILFQDSLFSPTKRKNF